MMAKAEPVQKEGTVEVPEAPAEVPATQESHAMAPIADDSELAEWAGAGAEAARPEDQTLPLLRILQSNSPEVLRGEAQIPGAVAGSILSVVDRVVFAGDPDQGLTLIPVLFQPLLIEWRVRELGGGFVAQHVVDPSLLASCKIDERNRRITDRGTQLVDTATWVVLRQEGPPDRVDPDLYEHGLLSLSSTQLKASRRWLSLATKVKVKGENGLVPAPLFACAYHATTVPQKNEQGQWFGWDIKQARRTTQAEVALAKALYLAFKRGEVKAKHEPPDGGDGDVPF